MDFPAFFYVMIPRELYNRRVKKMKIYCCEECVEIGLDTVVDKCETFPILSKIGVDNLSTTCEYCQKPATYVVANE